jgi:hypothetical protein
MHTVSYILFWQTSRVEIEEELDGEDGDEDDSENDNVQRRKFVANPRNSSTQQDESLVSFSCILTVYLNFFASMFL